MISFIVIGRNEEKNLTKCFKSIYDSIEFNKLKKTEIVYVDSKSIDKSIEIAKRFREIRIFQIIGHCNAAIGRNIGAKEAKGDILCFIDGDMELQKNFFSEILDEKQDLKFDIVSGQIINVENDIRYPIYKDNFFYKFNKKQPLSSGAFIIKKGIWDFARGMKTRYMTGEDPDLGLRLAKKGFFCIRKPNIICYHNNISYFDQTRMWNMLFNKSVFYSKCVLYRDHIFNKYMYYRMINGDKTFIILTILVIYEIINKFANPYLFFIYLIFVLLRCIKKPIKTNIIKYLAYYILSDILNFLFFFTFYPKSKETIYTKIL